MKDLELAIGNPSLLNNPEFWSEELLSQLDSVTPYSWNDDLGSGSLDSGVGLKISVLSELKDRTSKIIYELMDRGTSNRGSLGQLLIDLSNKSRSILDKGGWQEIETKVIMGGLVVRASSPISGFKQGPALFRSATDVARSLALN